MSDDLQEAESSSKRSVFEIAARYKSYPPEHFSRWRFYFQWLVLWVLIFPMLLANHRPRITGRENFPRKGRFIVASNHISLWDPPLVSFALNYPIAYMAKKELFRHPFMAEFFRSQGCFALDRDNPDSRTLKTAFHVLRSSNGWALGIFPEGTRSRDGQILPLKKGIGALACKTGTPILPVGIRKDRSGHYRVRIGPMITDVSDADQVQQAVYDALVELTRPEADS